MHRHNFARKFSKTIADIADIADIKYSLILTSLEHVFELGTFCMPILACHCFDACRILYTVYTAHPADAGTNRK